MRGEGTADTSVGAWLGTEVSVSVAMRCTGQHANLNLIGFLVLSLPVARWVPPREMASVNSGGAAGSSDAPSPIAEVSAGAGAGTEGFGGPANPDAGLAAASPAAQPPPLTAILQQVLASTQVVAASQQGIVARLDAIEQAQAQLQSPSQHLPIAAPPAGPAHAAAQPLPWAPGALGIPPQEVPVDPSQATAAAAVIDANARASADVWRALVGANLFLARGSFSVAVELSPKLLQFILKKVAGVSPAVAKQLQCVSGFVVEDVFPSAPAGETPAPMRAEVHFRAFIAALVAVLEYGMGSAPRSARPASPTFRKHWFRCTRWCSAT